MCWQHFGTAIPKSATLRWTPSYMSAFAQKWANWGTPDGVATSIIPFGFQGMGRACSDLGVTALVSREKVERLSGGAQ